MNLLTDPLFRVQTEQGTSSLSLTELLAALGRDEIERFIGIQRHQADAFFVFLCQLAAVILARLQRSKPVGSEVEWLEGLRALAGEAGDDAWTLVVEDLDRPAFMQPPLPRSDHAQLRPIEPSPYAPDALDLLPTAKNHDVKRARAVRPQPDEWIYALISLQTMSGFFGRGNPGISRMNSGFGNRSIVELVRSHRLGVRWCDAVTRLLEHRQVVLEEAFGYDPRGLVLLWCEPWDGSTSLPLSKLDPFYVEICRRVRLQRTETGIIASSVPSEANRIAANELRGVVGDPWLPIDLSSNGRRSGPDRALTVPPRGLTPDILRRLVFEDGVRLSALQRPLPSWKTQLWLTVSVLVRGQGTTEGFHERHIPIPPRELPRLFGGSARRDPLASLARTAIEVAGNMSNKVLKPAIFVYLEGAPDKLQFDRDSTQAWWTRFARRFESRWSDDYFPWLWSVPEPFDEMELFVDWARRMRDHALSVLWEVEAAMPKRQGRQWRARVRAERVFWGALYKHFPVLKEGRREPTTNT